MWMKNWNVWNFIKILWLIELAIRVIELCFICKYIRRWTSISHQRWKKMRKYKSIVIITWIIPSKNHIMTIRNTVPRYIALRLKIWVVQKTWRFGVVVPQSSRKECSFKRMKRKLSKNSKVTSIWSSSSFFIMRYILLRHLL